MMSFKEFYLKLVKEALEDSYRWKGNFESSNEPQTDDETGEVYMKDVLDPVQIIKFSTQDGREYIWYAKQSRYDETHWEIAFGEVKMHSGKNFILDITKSGKGDAFKILATVINITNAFIEFDENIEVRTMHFSSKESNRTKLYLNRLVPRIENFKLESVEEMHGETIVTLARYRY